MPSKTPETEDASEGETLSIAPDDAPDYHSATSEQRAKYVI